MTLYGAGASSVIWWDQPDGWLGGAFWLIASFTLGIVGVVQLRNIRKVASRSGRRPFDRTLARKIGAVIGIYTLAEGISALALHALHQDAFIFPIAVAIAGVHFWAFARVLGVWQYYLTGALDCLFVAITLLVASPRSMVGFLTSWTFYPLVGGGAALLITAGLMLYESRAIRETSR
jgi:hypothetical protein